jgi:hypothetical protein
LALLFLGGLVPSFNSTFGHDEPEGKAVQKAPAAEAPSLKADPAAAFAILARSVLNSKDATEVELPQAPDLFQFLSAAPGGRYVVRQLTFTNGDQVRAVSVALHPPHDMFLIRGKEVSADVFEGIYYVIDRTGWLKGAVGREGKTIKEVPLGDVWQAYETEKNFWLWQAEQISASSQSRR